MINWNSRLIVDFNILFDKYVESANIDLKHYIPVFARWSRYFSRKIESSHAIIAVFVDFSTLLLVITKNFILLHSLKISDIMVISQRKEVNFS